MKVDDVVPADDAAVKQNQVYVVSFEGFIHSYRLFCSVPSIPPTVADERTKPSIAMSDRITTPARTEFLLMPF